ncbi:uncharacterized protein LOC129957443 [Argiope bruennichi]|uniref:uncharacterized protein LOC129957443 n=1 Tax=Argiope bruennichi TaxID=94029 RepID=UPI002493E5D2|nr:uncharacterized protein LOC129957443 [Argiope bruennichi]
MEAKAQQRSQLAKSIATKSQLIAQLKEQLETKRKNSGGSVDDELGVAELEYRMVKEEMALLSLQEKHWESAALLHRETLHSSLRKDGRLPDLQEVGDRLPETPFGREASPGSRHLRCQACREAARLRLELTSVVGRLNRLMEENSNTVQLNDKLQKECEELRTQNRQLKLQVLSLLYLHQTMDSSSRLQKPILWTKPEGS